MSRCAVVGILVVFLACSSWGEPVHRWGLFETTFESVGPANVDPLRVNLDVEFTGPAGDTRWRRGFWDGGRTWKVRFAPGVEGDWHWRSRCEDDDSLDRRQGSFVCTNYRGDNPLYRHGPIGVSPNGRHLVHHDGTPFFWLVDTAWNGALKSTPGDWRRYLDDRAGKRFTGIQYVVTQWRAADHNAEGQVAYDGFDQIRIHPEFFHRIDARTRALNHRGLLAVPVLLWTLGDKETNPGQLPEDQAILLARYLTARLGAWHVAWFLPGDGNYTGANADRWKRIGRAVFDQPGHAPVTLHPQGMHWPWDGFREESWIDFLGYQSGHGDSEDTLRWIFDGPPAREWNRAPIRPVINLEPPYEDHVAYQSRRPHTDDSVRRAVYWSLLNAPTAGSSYGAHGVWSWETTAAVPQDHGGSGAAKPWDQAMALPGSTGMRHLAALFTSLPWWTLEPDPDLLAGADSRPPLPGQSHVVYTRDRDGRASLYIDGVKKNAGTIGGDLINWDPGYRLSLANELTGDRPWLGTLHRVSLFDHALGADEVQAMYAAGKDALPANPLVLYEFKEGGGATVGDSAGLGEAINLVIDQPDAVDWVDGGGLKVREPVRIASAGAATRVTRALTTAGQLTVEAWVTPSRLTQAGPARIVSLSRDTSFRNLTLGQDGPAYQVRCRTSDTSENGIPALASSSPPSPAHHVSASSSPGGDLAVIYAPVGGEIALAADRLQQGLTARWYNPRTGHSQAAPPVGERRYRAPDTKDWVLVVR